MQSLFKVDATGNHYLGCTCGKHFTQFRPKHSMRRIETDLPIFSPLDGSELVSITPEAFEKFMRSFLIAFGPFLGITPNDLDEAVRSHVPPIHMN